MPFRRHLRSAPPIALIALAALAVGHAGPASAAPPPTSPTSSPSPADPSLANKATFGLQPATHGKPDGRPDLRYGVTPGATFTDHVALINSSLQPYTIAVYATDAINDSEGALTLLAPGRTPTDAGSWITLGGKARSGHIRVPARSFVVFPITGVVPANAGPGDHVAGIVADLTTVTKHNGANVDLHQRVGLRTYVRVAGDVQAALAIQNLSVRYSNNWNPIGTGSTLVTYRVKNVGNVNLGARQSVAVDGLFGTTATARPAPIPLLLPGGTVAVSVRLHGVLPEIRMIAKVHVTPIVPAGNVEAGVSAVSASASFWAVPWVLIGIVVLLAGGALGLWRLRRKIKGSPGRHSAAKSSVRETSVRAKQEVGA